jgi:hypothetical protein
MGTVLILCKLIKNFTLLYIVYNITEQFVLSVGVIEEFYEDYEFEE